LKYPIKSDIVTVNGWVCKRWSVLLFDWYFLPSVGRATTIFL